MVRASLPWVDERGLWVDLDIAYSGSFRMTLSTKVNLMKLKKDTEFATADITEKPGNRRYLVKTNHCGSRRVKSRVYVRLLHCLHILKSGCCNIGTVKFARIGGFRGI